ncbi:unnamed protein product [Absidia cylindrospora]
MSRPFQPVILYKDDCRFDLPVEKKEQIHDMLRMNGRLWTILLSNQPPFDNEDESYSTPYDDDNIKKTRKGSSSPMLSSSSSSPPSSPSSTSSVTTAAAARKRRGNLPKSITCLLKEWLIVHADHPYPSDDEKLYLQQETQLTINQISNWFINARRRLLPCLQAESHRISVESSRGGKKKQVDPSKKQHGSVTTSKKSSPIIKKPSPPVRSRPKRTCRQQHASSSLLNADEWLE